MSEKSHGTTCNGVVDFRHAQETLWGEAGAWSYDTWHELNGGLFGSELEYAGIVWGLTPHGGCLGYCERSGRITLHRSVVDPHTDSPWAWPAERCTDLYARDILAHEMIHALLNARGAERDDRGGHHNAPEWCAEIMRLSPLLLGITINSEPVKPRRLNGKVVRKARDGFIGRDEVAHWPHAVRPNAAGYYSSGRRLSFYR
jgi:hypothetical protein